MKNCVGYYWRNPEGVVVYIGITSSFAKRKADHLKGKGGARALWNAIQKYGPDYFRVAICTPYMTREQADAWEIAQIAAQKPRYNITEGGTGGPRGEDWLRRLREGHARARADGSLAASIAAAQARPEVRAKKAAAWRTPETQAKARATHIADRARRKEIADMLGIPEQVQARKRARKEQASKERAAADTHRKLSTGYRTPQAAVLSASNQRQTVWLYPDGLYRIGNNGFALACKAEQVGKVYQFSGAQYRRTPEGRRWVLPPPGGTEFV